MTIPSKPSVHMETTLMSPPCHYVLYCTRQYVAIMRQPRCKRWSIIKCIPVKFYRAFILFNAKMTVCIQEPTYELKCNSPSKYYLTNTHFGLFLDCFKQV